MVIGHDPSKYPRMIADHEREALARSPGSAPSEPPSPAQAPPDAELEQSQLEPEINVEGERLYAEYLRQTRASLPPLDLVPTPLDQAVRFVEQWLPDALPANDKGQVPFGRALTEHLLDAAKGVLAARAKSEGR